MTRSTPVENAGAELPVLDAPAPPLARMSLGEGWTLWADFVLRGTGFPVDLVLELASPDAARAADEVIAAARELETARRAMVSALGQRIDGASGAERRGWARRLRRVRQGLPVKDLPEDDALARVHAAYCGKAASLANATERAISVLDAESRRIGTALRRLAANGPVREAIAWSNPAALPRIAGCLESPPARSDWKTRSVERLIANYVQRFATKNETIGFFGPLVWGTVRARDSLIACTPGPALLARRGVWFEYWPIDALAKAWSSTPELRRWAAPRRVPGVRLTGRTLSTPYGAMELEPAAARLLAACTGERSAHCLVRELGELGESDGFAHLVAWADQGIIIWSHEIPLEPYPERTLRRLVEAVEDTDLRGSLIGKLDELEGARRAVAASAGDAHAVEGALDALATTFERVLGRARTSVPRWGAREIVYGDCRRGLALEVSERVLDRIAPALRLLMAGHRWYSFALAERYRQVFDAIYEQLAPGGGPLDLTSFAATAYPLFIQFSPATGRCDRPGFVEEVGREFQARWARVLGGVSAERRVSWTSAELGPRVRETFAAPHAGWQGARHLCPDLMIAAASVEAINRGDYVPVLGELHASTSVETFCMGNQHPAPERLRAAHEQDFPRRVNLIGPKGWIFTRLCAFDRSDDVDFEVADLRSPRPRSETVGLSELFLLREGGRLVVKTHDGRRSWDIVGFLDTLLCHEEPPSFEPLLRHRPRLVLDQLVFQREAWRFEPATDLPFARHERDLDRFVGTRRWADDSGLPRHVFVGAPIERKPLYLDFESPILVETFLHLARRSPELTITEMLPGLEGCWLPDAEGRRYACELRMVAVDPEPWPADPV